MPNTRGAVVMTDADIPKTKIYHDDENPDPNLEELNQVIRGADRTIAVLSLACSNKARLLIQQGYVEIPDCCGSTACAIDHVARIHLQKHELTQAEVDQINEGLHRHADCVEESCICHPSFDDAHRLRIEDVTDIGDVHYLPNPMSDG